MINLEKIKYKKCQPSTPPPSPQTYTLLRGPAPAPYFHPLFLIFQISLSGKGNKN